jgi:multiple antibiotic resistance protein
MHTSLTQVFEFGLLALSSVFFLVDPIAAIPAFLAITGHDDAGTRRTTARRASLTCFFILGGFALAGSWLFKALGITLPAFKIAGGVILLQIGMDMLRARPSPTKQTPDEMKEGEAKEDVSIVPLGIPLLAGPGAISTVMVLVGEAHYWWQVALVYGAIVVTAAVSYVTLAGAGQVRRYLGDTGIRVLSRLMGLLLMAIAVQFVINGLGDLGLIKLPDAL